MADTFTVDTTSVERLVAAFRAAPRMAEAEMRLATDASLLLVIATLKEYPPQRPGSSYRRTRTLGRTWATARPVWVAASGGFQGRVGNATPYAPRVQGEGTQARVHKGRWVTDKTALDQNVEGILEQFDGANTRILQKVAESV